MLPRRLSFALAVVLAPQFAGAQLSDSTSGRGVGRWSGEAWLGYSPGSTSAGFLGQHTGLTLGMAGVRFNYRRRESRTVVEYTADVIPLARVTPLVYYSGDAAQRCPGPKFDCRRIAVIARGGGVSPLGVSVVYHADRSLQWRLGANGGFLYFDRPTPSDLATQFNFTAAIEAGMQYVSRGGRGVLLAYRLHHLSNAATGEDNLAMLSHVISIGGTWRFSR